MICTIIFDFGNVVNFFDHQIAIDAIKPYTPLDTAEIRRRIYAGQIEDDYEKGLITTEQFVDTVLELCEIDRTPEQYISAFVSIFRENPDVVGILPKLKKHYRILLASNTNHAHCEHFKIQFAEHLAHFDFLGVSHEAGARKPTVAFYEYIQKYAKCERSECLFVDDLPANVEAAIEFGWQAIVYSPGSKIAELMAPYGIQLD